ncbi:restriction endonuclease subunit S [Enterococcus durans]|uniref:restriction endonuclease subunit S n=3 Tax=Enterococcus TaxID=1350 RepID=UPI003EBC9AE9
MDEKKVPKLRFEGFVQDWEQRKSSSLMSFSNGINAPKENYGKGRKMISVMDILDEQPIKYEYIRNSVQVDAKIESKNKIEYGDLVFVRSSEVPEEVGWAKAYLEEEYALYSGFSIRGKKINEFNPYFVELTLNSINRKQIERKAGGSTRFNVSQTILNSLELLMPKIEEQNKIDKFFKQLDDTIALHQDKLNKLKRLKKGFLQVLFANKTTSPKVRFANFTEEWEQRKLSDVASIVGGGTPSTSNPEYWEGDIDWYAPAEIGDQIYVNKSLKTITELGQQKSSAKILPIGTVLFTSRAGIGNTAILAKEGTTNQGFQSIVPHENKLDSYFIFSRTHELKRYGEVTGAGSTFAEVSGKQMAKMPILIPCIDEQRKIGAFFEQLDNTIALHQNKLKILKQLKKSFLQKMFI